MEKQKQKTVLTLDEVCLKLNTYSDLDVLYCIDERTGSPAPPVIVKIVRAESRLRLWFVTDTLTERKARDQVSVRPDEELNFHIELTDELSWPGPHEDHSA